MIVYKYDENGIYTGETIAQESPREPSMYLMPPNTTAKIPPEIGDHECAIFGNESWDIKPDYRDVTYWLPDGSEYHITKINVVPPDSALFEKPFIPPTFDEAKAARLIQLNTAFERASQTAHCLSSAGFEINADEIANRNIEGLVLVLAERESTLFRAYDNSFHEVTKEQLETMRKEIVVNSQRLYRIQWQLEAAIKTAQTVEELEAIAITFDTVTQDDGGNNEQTA